MSMSINSSGYVLNNGIHMDIAYVELLQFANSKMAIEIVEYDLPKTVIFHGDVNV